MCCSEHHKENVEWVETVALCVAVGLVCAVGIPVVIFIKHFVGNAMEFMNSL